MSDEGPKEPSPALDQGRKLSALVFFAYLCAVFAYGPKQFFIEFGRMEPNEVGDLLAGAVSPFVFIWVYVAVLLQRSELQVQLKVLDETREELKLSREAQQKQLEVMDRQARIFDDEKRRRDEDVERLFIDRFVRAFVATIRLSDVLSIELRPIKEVATDNSAWQPNWRLIQPVVVPPEAEDAFVIYSRMIVEAAKWIEVYNKPNYRFRVPDDEGGGKLRTYLIELEKLVFLCRNAQDARDRASSIEYLLLDHLNLDPLSDGVRRIFSILIGKIR